MREASCCLCLTIIKRILLKLFMLISTSRYLDDILKIDSPSFEHMVGQIYLTEFQINKANNFDNEAPFLGLDLSITNGIVSSKINGMILILK